MLDSQQSTFVSDAPQASVGMICEKHRTLLSLLLWKRLASGWIFFLKHMMLPKAVTFTSASHTRSMLTIAAQSHAIDFFLPTTHNTSVRLNSETSADTRVGKVFS